ncbi:hypothetical protein ANN_17916 [Periplaneta americana]|uniref:HTH CENPB-type domain-containing protein n=1 Tax=Periplaneta americana TaxID=6978 RepID=A0ABQ8SNJ9_PERAM|nr:hypothetical protein ANN_17916 [Periplaneta americana]
MSPKRRKLWKEEDMKAAIISVRNKVMGLQRASNTFNVPKSTLKDKVNSKEEDVDKLVSTKLGRKPVLPFELEDSLVSYCLEMEKRFYGLSARDVKTMAFQLASLNGLKHPFSKNDEAAGWKWLHSFLRRHQELSLRKPQSTSMARIRGFNQENVIKFFDIYEPLMNIINHSPNRLYNCDETGLTVVQHKVNKVVSLKGKRQVGSVSSAERGSLVTAVTCMSAAGHFLPPLLVFPRVNMKTELLDGAPNGSLAVCHKSGWIQNESFVHWFHHFLSNVKPTKDDPVILVLDGHYSHTRNVELLELARANGVHIVCLPPHCTHKMQPLDVAFMLPFKTYYAQAIEQWLKQNAGRVVTHYQVGMLLGEAFNKAATVAVATNGFRKTGLYPCNRHIFSDFEFQEASPNNHEASDHSPEALPNRLHDANTSQPRPGPSGINEPKTPPKPVEKQTTPFVTPVDISPVPTIQQKNPTDRGRKSGSAALLTSSPYKNQLADDVKRKSPTDKKTYERKSVQKKQADKVPTQKKIQKKQSQISSDSEGEELDDPVYISTDNEDSEDDAECPYCNGKFSCDKRGEKWIVCTKCGIWCHEECSGEDDYKSFICVYCLEG